jgi:hypothetical protein
MGPLLYLTPGAYKPGRKFLFIIFVCFMFSHAVKIVHTSGTYTQTNQDGIGTVADSGHTCLSGFNKVVMLRSMPHTRKAYACEIMPTLSGQMCTNAEAIVFGKPHHVTKDKLGWITMDAIGQWKGQKYVLGLSTKQRKQFGVHFCLILTVL